MTNQDSTCITHFKQHPDNSTSKHKLQAWQNRRHYVVTVMSVGHANKTMNAMVHGPCAHLGQHDKNKC
jgi:ribosomal protein S15P/S13E